MSPRRNSASWSTPADVAARLRRRWDSGALLGDHARGRPFEPVAVPLRGPSAGEIAEHLDRVRAWVAALDHGASRRGGATYRLERRPVGGRALGSNELPVRAWVESYDAAWRLLDVRDDVAGFDQLLTLTSQRQPAALDWVRDHPLQALSMAEEWERLLEAAAWIASHGGQGRYLREIDAPGVDTKFIERHRAILADLVDALRRAVVSPEAIVEKLPGTQPQEVLATATEAEAANVSRTDLAGRYGYLRKPAYVRLRFGSGAFPGDRLASLTEATLRVDELARLEPAARRVFVLENEVTYLAFPVQPNSLVVFGGGYTVGVAGSLPWLEEREILYWGDLDTHGFAILNRLRHRRPHVQSLLMDRGTLLAHRELWGTEPKPTRAHLDRLTVAESDLYQDLVEDTFGPAVRLEQERVGWPAVEAALSRLSS